MLVAIGLNKNFRKGVDEIKIVEILEELNHIEIDWYFFSFPDVLIKAMENVSQLPEITDSHLLYFGVNLDDINIDDGLSLNNISIICKKNTRISKTYLNNINIIVLKEDVDLLEIFSRINKRIYLSNKWLFHSMELFDFFSERKTLQDIVDFGEKLLDCSLCITSSSLKILAISKNIEILDHSIVESFESTGYFPKNYVFYQTQNNIHKLLDESNHPIFWKNQFTKENLILGKIMVKEKRVGVLSVAQGEKPFTDESLEIVKFLCSAASIQMEKNKHYLNYAGKMYEDLLIELLDENSRGKNILVENIKKLEKQLKTFNYFFLFDFSYFDNEIVLISYVLERLAYWFPFNKSTVYNNYIVSIVSTEKNKEDFEDYLKNLNTFLYENNINCGISMSIKNLINLREYFIQAQKALKLGKNVNNKENLFLYENYFIYELAELNGKSDNYRQLCHPAIFMVLEYDRKSNTNFSMSLYYYVKNLKSISEAANHLYTHRNTMIYRIKKIEEITQLDLHDSKIIFQLYYSYLLMEYYEPETTNIFFKKV